MPNPSWVLDPVTFKWKAPKDKPAHDEATEFLVWDEQKQDWVKDKFKQPKSK